MWCGMRATQLTLLSPGLHHGTNFVESKLNMYYKCVASWAQDETAYRRFWGWEQLTLRWCCRFYWGECEARWRPTSAVRSTLSPTPPQCRPALTAHKHKRISMCWCSPTQSILLLFIFHYFYLHLQGCWILVKDWFAICFAVNGYAA